MSKNKNQILAEKEFWSSWGNLESNASKNSAQIEGKRTIPEPNRRDDKEFAARFAEHLAQERRKENLKLMAMMVVGVIAISLTLYLLGLIEIKKAPLSAAASGNSHSAEAVKKVETPEMIEASIEEEMAKGGFSTREAYFNSELTKQAHDVGMNLDEFSKNIKPLTPKMNITSLVIAGKIEQFSQYKTVNGFGIELVESKEDESDEVKLISHLKGMTSTVEFFAENGRVVAHFKDYPPSYCAGTKGAAVCGS